MAHALHLLVQNVGFAAKILMLSFFTLSWGAEGPWTRKEAAEKY